MKHWWSDIKVFFKWLIALFALIFLLFVINQCILFYQLIASWNTNLAMIMLGVLLVVFLGLAVKMIRLFRTVPETLNLSEDASDEEILHYQTQLYEQLKSNPHLNEFEWDEALDQAQQIEQALNYLQTLSTPIIKENANAIFLSTAISQNGALDTLMVLYTLFRMVWQITLIYGTRPTPKNLMKLYGQIFGVLFMARQIEELDLIEHQLEPIITSVLGESVVSAIPGMIPIANLVVSSILEGAVNAFLTLRVGMITQSYLTSQSPISIHDLRNEATRRALPHLKVVIKENSQHIVKSIARTAKNMSKNTAKRWFNMV